MLQLSIRSNFHFAASFFFPHFFFSQKKLRANNKFRSTEKGSYIRLDGGLQRGTRELCCS